VHGEDAARPAYLDERVELQIGDVRDPHTVREALRGVDAVFHFAALVGVGQSMYEVAAYTDVNGVGTGVLLEALRDRPVEKLVVASSMSVYGEGAYRDDRGRVHEDVERSVEDLRRGRWEPRGDDGSALVPLATPETKAIALSSVYALSKYDQERLCLILGRAYGIPTVALRFFNVYGPRQALSNPYTGVLAIFAARLLHGAPPLIFEDGLQRRDFVSVHDVARACRLVLGAREVTHDVLNVGSGRSVTIREIAERMAAVLGRDDVRPMMSGQHRVGDIRHCFADVARARERLDYEPRVSLEEGMAELAEWLRTQTAEDRVEEAHRELASRGLTL
jgi:dTDP-L-rhamnose 4-epimerase